MATINYTAAEINTLLSKADTAIQADNLNDAVNEVNENIRLVSNKVGDLDDLLTDDKDSAVDAINENFTAAGEIKGPIAEALTGKGIEASATDSAAVLAEKIGQLQPSEYVDPALYVRKWVQNDTEIIPTGTYATSTYYNTTYGVKIGYQSNGDIIISMQAGTTTSYEYLYFYLASAPAGVTLTETHNTSSSYATAAAGLIYGAVLSGIDFPCTISLVMSTYNGTGDYTRVDITVTEVTA